MHKNHTYQAGEQKTILFYTKIEHEEKNTGREDVYVGKTD